MSKVVYSVLVAFLISLLLSPLLIPLLTKFKFGQNIRDEGPKSHLEKAGTPTMGGLIFIIASDTISYSFNFSWILCFHKNWNRYNNTVFQ